MLQPHSAQRNTTPTVLQQQQARDANLHGLRRSQQLLPPQLPKPTLNSQQHTAMAFQA